MNTKIVFSKAILQIVFVGVLVLFPSKDLCVAQFLESPRMIRNVGEEAVFMWNASNTTEHFFRAFWGLMNKDLSLKTRFMLLRSPKRKPWLLHNFVSSVSRYRGRVGFVGDPRAGHLWFKLSNLTLDDSGRYGVELFHQHHKYHYTDLIVTAPPTFSPSLKKYNYIYIQEGANISIHCSAVGPPAPNVTWFQNTSVTMVAKSHGVGSATLSIPNVTRETSGVYECQAINNPNERPISMKTNIVLMHKPNILEHNLTKNVTSCNTISTILLYCRADGIPLPQISWVAPDGHPVTTGYETIGDGSVISVLKVVKHGNEDDGLYRCRMENIIGSDEHVFDVSNEYITGSSCDSMEKEKTSATEPKTSCAPAIAVCVTIIILLLILNVVQFVITRKKFKAKDETLEMEMDIMRKDQRTTRTDRPLYENVSGRSGGAPGTRLGDAHDADSQCFHRDGQRTTLETSHGTDPVKGQEENDTQVYAALGDRDPTPVYQKLSFGDEKTKVEFD